MFTILSLVTSIKDYIEVVHKLVETNNSSVFELTNYSNFGAILSYIILNIKELFITILQFKWLQNVVSLPFLVPDIASAMLSEISVLDGYFHNSFTFLETPISYGNQNFVFYGIEKFSIGLINSIFLCLPTSTAHIITLRRFLMQGLEAGYLAGLGTLSGNILWIGSIIFGVRFLVIPWLSLDILRYGLGFLLLSKYMWDTYNEKKAVVEDLSKWKIFMLNFLLAFTEQSTLYPFLTNLSIGSDTTILESFPTNSFGEYLLIHSLYLGGLIIGGLTLLQFTCWFLENPAFNFYMWSISSLKLTSISQKFLNVLFLYLTMFFAISNFSYFGLDYLVTNPLGFVHEDRIIDQKTLFETSFLNSKASDRNTRRNRGRHGRRERWKRRVRRYRTFDASLYDQGVYDLFTIEDLNYGFDRFWLRRKLRNHRVRFRFFPGPWMRSFKKQLARPRLESFMGPRVEFFRILFEQAYHPEFHEFRDSKTKKLKQKSSKTGSTNSEISTSFYSEKNIKVQSENLKKEYSALRKFVRKLKTRTKLTQILLESQQQESLIFNSKSLKTNSLSEKIYSKRWKQIFSKISHNINQTSNSKSLQQHFLFNFNKQKNEQLANSGIRTYFKNSKENQIKSSKLSLNSSKNLSENQLSPKDRQILRYKTLLFQSDLSNNSSKEFYKPLTLLHPISFYLQKEKAFQKKMKFYGANLFRNFGIENNAPYYRVMMKKFFYYYKPTLRWERTMRNATMRKARRKNKRIPRKLNITKQTQLLGTTFSETNLQNIKFDENLNSKKITLEVDKTKIQKPTHFYSLVTKRATRYRYQIYKDVLQHWYYSPFNRLLLKFDVDAFINRQPITHFITKKEENLLHLKRFLLGDYYNTLRWYNYMQHYSAMKNNIGKTKSFASNTYNQQFFGTFKKIRHLFAITPNLTNTTILKFDQPLFNEYPTNLNQRNKNQNFVNYNSSILHEELLNDEELYVSNLNVGQDLTNQATSILKEYLKTATPVRQNYIKKLIQDENYVELTNFLFKGQKMRGIRPTTNETTFLDQEKNYILNIDDKKVEQSLLKNFFETKMFKTSNNQSINTSDSVDNSSYLWLSLMKKSRNLLYNQEALRFYINGRLEKHEKQKKRQERAFKVRLENLKKWVYSTTLNSRAIEENQTNQISGLTTSLQKAIKEGLYFQNAQFLSGKNLEKSNLRNNHNKLTLKLLASNSKKIDKNPIHLTKSNLSKTLRIHLNNRVKLKALETLETEKRFRESLKSIQTNQRNTTPFDLRDIRPNLLRKLVTMTLVPFKLISLKLSQNIETELNKTNTNIFKKAQKSFFKLFTENKEKSLKNWNKKENVFLLRKKIRRKIYRVLDQKKSLEKTSNISELENFSQNKNIFKKEDIKGLLDSRRIKGMWNNYEKDKFLKFQNLESPDTTKSKLKIFSSFNFLDLFDKHFKRKRTRSRRYRYFKGRGPIKKHTRAEKLKRQFKLLKRYQKNAQVEDKKIEILQMITKRKYKPDAFFEIRDMKQRRTRQSKHRYWKKHKRQKYLQLKRKQRKRRRYTISKLRVLNKEFKRLKNQIKLKSWWSQSFLPNFMSTFDSYWQIEKNKQIKEELEKLSMNDILERDQLISVLNKQDLQIGETDFKPLALPQALEIKNRLIESGKLNFEPNFNIKGQEKLNATLEDTSKIKTNIPSDLNIEKTNLVTDKSNLISKLSSNLFENSTMTNNLLDSTNVNTKKIIATTPIPFYAGWDETLHKFVVTTRLLSRKDAGYSINFSPFMDSNKNEGRLNINQFTKLTTGLKDSKLEFTKAPLQGMNAATTLYWQIPFTTYDPDQFFALGMDGFSPLGWRFFNFKHAKETTKPIRVQTIFSKNQNKLRYNSLLTYSIHLKMLELNKLQLWNSKTFLTKENTRISKNQSRKIQKRQKRVKKHPRPPVWFPAGPLSNQILPVHYIYVFYKRTRLPRDRYIARRFRRSEDPKSEFLKTNFNTMFDFTLRKRIKPIRKYHRKTGLTKTQEGTLIVRRRGFKQLLDTTFLIRPILQTRLTNQTNFLNASLLKSKERKKTLTSKSGNENLRIRQLRRRIQRQVLRPVWRYKPRPGGFLWPGDYFRLEGVQAPLLKNSVAITQEQSLNSIRKKKRRSIQEWQVQPKKYLLEKHNLKVIKKRLRAAQNVNKLNYKINEFNLRLPI